MGRKNALAKIIDAQARSMVSDTVGQITRAVTFVLNDRGYGAEGVRKFAAEVQGYLDGFEEARAIDKDYFRNRYEGRLNEIMQGEPVTLKLYVD